MEPAIVYFSRNSENTLRFVEKLPYPSYRIPISKREEPLVIDRDFVLVIPTYGAGQNAKAVAPQVARFFQREEHREHCLGVIGGGNRAYGHEYFVLGARVLAKLLDVPLIHAFEVLGMPSDVQACTDGIEQVFSDKERRP